MRYMVCCWFTIRVRILTSPLIIENFPGIFSELKEMDDYPGLISLAGGVIIFFPDRTI